MGKHFVASLLISHVMIRVKDEGLAGNPGLHVTHVNRVKVLRFILMISRQTVGREITKKNDLCAVTQIRRLLNL